MNKPQTFMLRLPASVGLLLVTAAFLSGIVALFSACQRQDPTQSETTLAIARRENPVEGVKQQLSERINRYLRGEAKALSFLPPGATNVSVVRVTPSGNTNLPSVDAVLMVDGKRHYLEIPTSIFPTVFIPILPPPPTEPEFRRYLEQQVECLMNGQKSDLSLSSQYHWTNIVIESFTVLSNYTRTYPYRAEGIVSAQGLTLNALTPVQHRLRLDIRYMEEDRGFIFSKEITQ
jgi:hypothetical protein